MNTAEKPELWLYLIEHVCVPGIKPVIIAGPRPKDAQVLSQAASSRGESPADLQVHSDFDLAHALTDQNNASALKSFIAQGGLA